MAVAPLTWSIPNPIQDYTTSTLSPMVRSELSKLEPNQYTLYETRDSDPSPNQEERDEQEDLEARGAQIGGLIERCTASKCLSMTFDDGPYLNHKKVVDTLESEGMKSTFFVNGQNFRCIYDTESVSALRYSYSRGHEICSHSWSHPHLSGATNEELDRQVQLVEDALYKILGVVPSCFRPPYGEITDDQVKYLNDRWGLQVINWNYDTMDANGATVDYSLNVYRNLKAPKHAIVLNHETVNTTANTVIPQAVKIVKQNGYSGSRTLSDTLGFNPYKVVGQRGKRDSTWTCDGKPAPGVL
ncbi:glycoside hydrolase/deacetylase [Violaceomyces palustris]|uniref:Glycoside hydrolase/deacetylase n=1 Tax=Violaceomyces palustris TaxID=1673888 RepID=A0ACD0NKW3_9BASI|nr:glycoside hydrolase/deacetylase [Violaceomyces palustris]